MSSYLIVADLDNWVQFLIIIVPLVIGGLSALVKKANPAQNPAIPKQEVPPPRNRPPAPALPRRVMMPPAPQRPREAPRGQPMARPVSRPGVKPVQQAFPAKPQDPLAAEIEDFLQRVTAKKRADAAQGPAVKRGAPSLERPAKKPTAGMRGPAPAPKLPPEEPKPVSVAEHVRMSLSPEKLEAHARELRSHAQGLGAGVRQREEERQRELQQKFQHQLGKLEGSRASSEQEGMEAATPSVPPVGRQIASMLRDPQRFRQAVVLSILLERKGIR